MATLEQLTKQRSETTDAKIYDELTGAIATAQRERDLAAARRQAEINEQIRQEREAVRNEYRANLAKIQQGYEAIMAMDHDLFAAALTMVETMAQRTRQEAELHLLEEQLILAGEHLGFKYQRPAPALLGSTALYADPNKVIKTWLQRCADWSHYLGRTPTLEEVASHGLQTSTEMDDAPGRF